MNRIEKVPMTAGGKVKLEGELLQLKTVERPGIILAIAEARAHGDLSENAEYHAAKDKQGIIEGRIAELEGVLSRAEVIDPKRLNQTKICFGVTVVLENTQTQKEETYQIVGRYESNLKEGKLSLESPLARALIGKEAGDEVIIHPPQGTRIYQVVRFFFA